MNRNRLKLINKIRDPETKLEIPDQIPIRGTSLECDILKLQEVVCLRLSYLLVKTNELTEKLIKNLNSVQ